MRTKTKQKKRGRGGEGVKTRAGRKGSNQDVLKVSRRRSYGKMSSSMGAEDGKCLRLATAKTVRSLTLGFVAWATHSLTSPTSGTTL